MKSRCSHLVLGAALLLCGCNQKTPSPLAPRSSLPFDYTNVVHGVSEFANEPTPETIIAFTNLAWFGHQKAKLSMGLGAADYEISVFFTPSNRSVRKIIQQTTVGSNRFWLTDSNGDGLPDERKQFGQREREILLRGEWTPARGLWSNLEALVDTNWTRVHFTNGRWQVK
jgi:hypothetical protein